MRIIYTTIFFLLIFLSGCYHELISGPDKRFLSMSSGALSGAGAGAITGFHLSSATGPGAFIGAGFGAVAGSLHGFVQDIHEDMLLKLKAETKREMMIAQAHEILADHYKRRMELHPTRDIFSADLFFEADHVDLRKDACTLLSEIARLNKDRYAWSRLVVAVYIKAKNEGKE